MNIYDVSSLRCQLSILLFKQHKIPKAEIVSDMFWRLMNWRRKKNADCFASIDDALNDTREDHLEVTDVYRNVAQCNLSRHLVHRSRVIQTEKSCISLKICQGSVQSLNITVFPRKLLWGHCLLPTFTVPLPSYWLFYLIVVIVKYCRHIAYRMKDLDQQIQRKGQTIVFIWEYCGYWFNTHCVHKFLSCAMSIFGGGSQTGGERVALVPMLLARGNQSY